MASHPDMSVSAVELSASAQAPPSGRSALDELRAATYGFLAALLTAPPGGEVLALLERVETSDDTRGLSAEDAALAGAWQMLKLAAGATDISRLDDEYHALFIGLGRGELVPYACWYLTGILMDRPLACLREDLRALGIERQAGVQEPEDHAGALCEAMHEIIRAETEIPMASQRRFFHQHIEPWMPALFRDLQQARCACFYISVGRLGETFLALESHYLDGRV